MVIFLEQLIQQAELKIDKANRRIDAPLPDNALLSEEQQQQVDKMNEEVSKLLKEAERAGERGDVEEAARLTRNVQTLKKESERASNTLYGSYMQREKSLRVCPICGAMQSVGDSMSRFESHVTGKQHIGFEKIRSCLEELKRRKEEREKAEKAKVPASSSTTSVPDGSLADSNSSGVTLKSDYQKAGMSGGAPSNRDASGGDGHSGRPSGKRYREFNGESGDNHHDGWRMSSSNQTGGPINSHHRNRGNNGAHPYDDRREGGQNVRQSGGSYYRSGGGSSAGRSGGSSAGGRGSRGDGRNGYSHKGFHGSPQPGNSREDLEVSADSAASGMRSRRRTNILADCGGALPPRGSGFATTASDSGKYPSERAPGGNSSYHQHSSSGGPYDHNRQQVSSSSAGNPRQYHRRSGGGGGGGSYRTPPDLDAPPTGEPPEEGECGGEEFEASSHNHHRTSRSGGAGGVSSQRHSFSSQNSRDLGGSANHLGVHHGHRDSTSRPTQHHRKSDGFSFPYGASSPPLRSSDD